MRVRGRARGPGAESGGGPAAAGARWQARGLHQIKAPPPLRSFLPLRPSSRPGHLCRLWCRLAGVARPHPAPACGTLGPSSADGKDTRQRGGIGRRCFFDARSGRGRSSELRRLAPVWTPKRTGHVPRGQGGLGKAARPHCGDGFVRPSTQRLQGQPPPRPSRPPLSFALTSKVALPPLLPKLSTNERRGTIGVRRGQAAGGHTPQEGRVKGRVGARGERIVAGLAGRAPGRRAGTDAPHAVWGVWWARVWAR